MELKIKAAHNHGRFGTFMFNLCARWTEFLVKHRWLYYLLACTWGVIMTILGLFITLGCAIGKLFGAKITFIPFHWIYAIKVGPSYWGGCEMGLMFFRDQNSSDKHINPHEFGHTFQNCLFGPLGIILIFLPSAIRYWYREIRIDLGKSNGHYDSIWFEDAATQCGKYACEYLENKNK